MQRQFTRLLPNRDKLQITLSFRTIDALTISELVTRLLVLILGFALNTTMILSMSISSFPILAYSQSLDPKGN